MAEKGGRRYAETLAQGLASGLTRADAGRRAGVSPRTVHRCMADPGFVHTVQALRGEMIGRASGILADCATEAVETMRTLLGDGSAMVRLGAARAILDQLVRVRDATELEERIEALEARAREAGAPGTVVPLSGWKR